jgi:hypothetical protein
MIDKTNSFKCNCDFCTGKVNSFKCDCDFCTGKKLWADNWCARCGDKKLEAGKTSDDMDACDDCSKIIYAEAIDKK